VNKAATQTPAQRWGKGDQGAVLSGAWSDAAPVPRLRRGSVSVVL